jgi:hypothetical protein
MSTIPRADSAAAEMTTRVLGSGLAAMLAVNALLLRLALDPLIALAERMNRVDAAGGRTPAGRHGTA